MEDEMKLSTKLMKGVVAKILRKAIKNKCELQNIRQAHLKDGIALCKFFRFAVTWFAMQIVFVCVFQTAFANVRCPTIMSG